MTNGEDENKKDVQDPIEPAPEPQQAPEPQPAPEPQQAPIPPRAPEPPQAPIPPRAPERQPMPKKSSSFPILAIVGIVVVLLIAAVVVLFATGTFDNIIKFESAPTYQNHTVGKFTFQIPEGFEKDKSASGEFTIFKNDTNKFIRIADSDQRLNLYVWALAVQQTLGIPGDKVDINGTPAYKFEAEDIVIGGDTAQTVLVYAINLDGESYLIVLSKGIESPDEFLGNITRTE